MSDLNAAALDVLGVGNAIVDVIGHCDDAFLAQNGVPKGGMQLIDADEALRLHGLVTNGREASGGSAANTIAGLAGLGARTGFIGKLRADAAGDAFAADLARLGVAFDTPRAPADYPLPTARCVVLVTPDAQRSMSTLLGVSVELAPADVDEARVAAAEIIYLEGYLWDQPAAKDAFRKAISIARQAGRKVALSLSDGFCVDRHRAEFRALVEKDVDILFANEAEITSLFETSSFDEALQAARACPCPVMALTRSEKGSVVAAGDEVHVVDAIAPRRLVDTTGAGDLYAAGFLFGLRRGRDLAVCAAMGGCAAAEVIAIPGARVTRDLKDAFRQAGLPV